MDEQKLLNRYENSKYNLNIASKHFERVQEEMYRELIAFYDKIAFLSGGTISLSISFLVPLKGLNGIAISQFSYLFIIGISSLTLCLVFGLSERILRGKANWFSAKETWANRLHIHTAAEKELVEQGIAININQTNEDKYSQYIRKFKEYETSDKKQALKYFSRAKLVELLTPCLFLIGILFVSAYFLSQIFDF